MAKTEEELLEEFDELCADIPIDPAKYNIEAIRADWMKEHPEDIDEIYALINRHFTNPKERLFALIPEITDYEPDLDTNPYEEPEAYPASFPDDWEYPQGFIKAKPITNGWRVTRYLVDSDRETRYFDESYVSDMDYIWYELSYVIAKEAQLLYDHKW